MDSITNFYPYGFERAEGAVWLADAKAAMDDFKSRFKANPEKLIMNPSLKAVFEGAFPEDIILEASGGCGKWEIGVSSTLISKPAPPIEHLNTPSSPHVEDLPASLPEPGPLPTINVNKPVKVPYHHKGQPTIYDGIIKEVIGQGGSLMAMVYKLEQRGIKISHMTIQRRIKANV